MTTDQEHQAAFENEPNRIGRPAYDHVVARTNYFEGNGWFDDQFAGCLQIADVRAVVDFCVNVILARRCVSGVESELPLPNNIRACAEFRDLKNSTETTGVRIGVII